MNPDPATDVIAFLTKPAWYTWVFWVLLIASAAIAAYVAARIPEQRTGRHFARWIFRLLIGTMWWQQTLWKLPPYYTDQPDAPFGTTGLANWMNIMGQHASIPLQADFVNQIVLPNFYWFAPIVYLAELLTALSLMLGAFVGLFGLIGALQILNLWLGLYSAPNEWPWTYFFLIVLQLIFAFDHYGRSLGVDALLGGRRPSRSALGRAVA
jgi:thiosulfate dehydrogenase (quinone) large subunit